MKKLIKNIFSLIVFIIMLLAIIEVLKLDVLPNRYLFMFIGGELLLFILGLLLV